MLSSFLKYVAYFIGLVLIQVLVLNNIELSGFLNPYVYVLFILILPFETPGWLLLLSAFLLGLTIDIFPQGIAGGGGTLGIHAASTVLMAFFRPMVLRWTNSRGEYEKGTTPSARDYGFSWYAIYALFMVGIHHFLLFLIENFGFSHFINTLGRFLFSLLFTLIIILIWEGFRFKPRKN